MSKATGTHNGVEFQITDLWTFFVPVLDRHYKSYPEMIAAIESTASLAPANKLSHPMLNEAGKEVLLTGLHPGRGHFLAAPATGEYCKRLFVRAKWTAGALTEAASLESRAAAIRKVLERFSILGPSYQFKPTDYESEHARVQKEIIQKTEAADATDLAAELAKAGL